MRWKQDAGAILLWLSIPLVIGALVTTLMDGGGGAKPHGVLLITDLDDSLLSGLVAGAYSQGELGELISVEKVSLASGTEKINAGEASGLLIIPAGFTQAFLDSTPVTLTLKTNPAQTILPGIINDVTEILLDAGFYAEQLFTDEIAQIQELATAETPDDVVISALALAIQKKIQAAAPQIFPPAIELELVEPPAEEADAPMALLYLPGVILMALMFSANGLAGDYWTEKDQGSLRRHVYAPGRLTGFLAGKALAAAFVIAIIGGLTLVIGFVYHDISWARLPPAFLWISVSGLALFSWFSALQMVAKTRHAANLISSMLLFPLLMAGGSFFPFAALPDWIAALGRKTPNGFIADRLTSEIIAGSAWTIDLYSWLIIFTLAVCGLLVSAWRLQSGFARD